MSQLMVIKRNAAYEEGMYGYSLHEAQTGGAGNVIPVKTEEDFRKVLLGFGLSAEYSDDVIDRLKNKHDSVKIDLETKTLSGLSEPKAS